MMDKIAVLIPCYNEAQTIKKVVDDAKKYIPGSTVYVYDNNSTDGTDEEAKAAGAVVRYEYQQGKGNVIRRMFREIDAECYVLVDGDDTYALNRTQEAIRMICDKKADMVIGDRLSSTYFTENKRRFHGFGNRFVRMAINKIFHNNIQDIMTGYRVFSYEFVKTFPVLSQGFEIETEMTIHALSNNLHIENLVIDYKDRAEGSASKLNTISDGIKVLKTIFRLFKNYKPVMFFGLCSLFLLTTALVMFLPVFVEFLQTGIVLRFPTLIVSGFIAIAAIVSFFSGIILDVLHEHDRKNFEYRLISVCLSKNERK